MLLDEIGTYLQNAGVGTLGKSLFRSPEFPTTAEDTATAIIESGGFRPGYVHDRDGPSYDRPSFQLLHRAKDLAVARAKAELAWKALGLIKNRSIEGWRYLRVTPVQSPFGIGKDENGRELVSCNYDVIRETQYAA